MDDGFGFLAVSYGAVLYRTIVKLKGIVLMQLSGIKKDTGLRTIT